MMSRLPDVVSAVAQRYRRWRFEAAVQEIVTLPPVSLSKESTVTFLSMVHHRDVLAYLLAIKTLARSVAPARVVVVCDPSLSDGDQGLIGRHVSGVEFVEARQFHIQNLPTGGTWERLIAIATLVGQSYVIQFDADTVTLGPISEVVDASRSNQAFLLASEAGLEITTLDVAVTWARKRSKTIKHVQVQAEANLDALESMRWRYVRACSGFAGFPKGAFEVDRLREVSEAMRSRLGDRWAEWGTEQVTSNLICASQPKALLLPNPKYCNADLEQSNTEFLHFIGYARFTTSRYADLARAVSRGPAGRVAST